MHLIGSFVVRHTKSIITVFVISMLLGEIMALGVHVNLDNIGYLPDTSSAKRAAAMLQDEFGLRGTSTLMIHEPDPVRVRALKQKLEPCLKWSHGELRLPLGTVAKAAVRGRYFLIPLLMLLAFIFFRAQGKVDYYYGMDNILPVNDTALTAQAEIRRVYGNTEQSTLLLPIGDPAGEAALAAELENLDGVVSVDGLSIGAASRLPESLLPASLVKQFRSDKSSMLVLTTNQGAETEKAFILVEQVRAVVDRHAPEAVIAGGAFTYKDLKDVTDADSRRVAILSAIFIFLIILITFRSLAIPLIAVFLIQTAIWVNVRQNPENHDMRVSLPQGSSCNALHRADFRNYLSRPPGFRGNRDREQG